MKFCKKNIKRHQNLLNEKKQQIKELFSKKIKQLQ